MIIAFLKKAILPATLAMLLAPAIADARPAMGHAVANRCVLLLCIGHASEVTQLCERGLDLAVNKLHAQLSELSFRALRFEAGNADLWDARVTGGPLDGRVDRIDRGTFTKASIDVGTGPRACRATFSGERSP